MHYSILQIINIKQSWSNTWTGLNSIWSSFMSCDFKGGGAGPSWRYTLCKSYVTTTFSYVSPGYVTFPVATVSFLCIVSKHSFHSRITSIPLRAKSTWHFRNGLFFFTENHQCHLPIISHGWTLKQAKK